MLILIKAIGFLSIVSASYGYGLLKTGDFKQRKNNLGYFLMGLDKLFDDVRIGAFERLELIKRNFEDLSLLKISENLIETKENKFFKKDNQTINEFLDSFGKSDKQGECERIEIYKKILEQRFSQVSDEYKSKSKVWKTVSLCLGITIGVLLV